MSAILSFDRSPTANAPEALPADDPRRDSITWTTDKVQHTAPASMDVKVAATRYATLALRVKALQAEAAKARGLGFLLGALLLRLAARLGAAEPVVELAERLVEDRLRLVVHSARPVACRVKSRVGWFRATKWRSERPICISPRRP